MATVIDALVVTLGLNAKGFASGVASVTKGLKGTSEEASRTGAQMEKVGKQATESFSKLRNEVLSLLAVFTAGVGIKNFVENTITGSAALGRMSQNLDMSARDLTAWQRAAERAGVSAESITTQLQESARSAASFRMGQADATMQGFFRFGGKSEDLKDGNTYLMARARIVSDLYRTDKQRAALVAQQMGIDQTTFDLIKQGPQAIAQLVDAQRKRIVVTDEDAKKAAQLREKFLDLRDEFSQIGTKVVIALIPAFEKIIGFLERLAGWFDQHKDEIAEGVSKFVDNMIKFAGAADKAAQSVGGWQNVLLALVGIKVAGFVLQLISLAGALGRVAGSLTAVGAAGSSGGALAALGALSRILGPIALMLHSEDLNANEDAELAKYRNKNGGAPTIDNRSINKGSAAQAVEQLQKMGWTREQAIGVAANLQIESGFDPKAVGDNGKAYGIAQWHGDRQAKFKQVFGKDIQSATFNEQLQFLDWELRNTEQGAGSRLGKTKNASDSARVVSRDYERPADQMREMERRASVAMQISDSLQGNRYAQGSVTNNSPSTTNSVQIDKIEVHTNASDADGIAKSIGPAVKRQNMASMANTGVN